MHKVLGAKICVCVIKNLSCSNTVVYYSPTTIELGGNKGMKFGPYITVRNFLGSIATLILVDFFGSKSNSYLMNKR